MDAVVDLVAASIAGSSGIVVGNPFDVLKVRFQSDLHSKYRSVTHAAQTILQEEGFRGFMKGCSAMVLANAPLNAILFVVEGQAMKSMADVELSHETKHFLAGSISGVAQTVVAGPSELVKIRRQLMFDRFTSTSPSTFGTMRLLMEREGGLRALAHGSGLTALRDGPAFGIYFYVYHWLKDFMRSHVPLLCRPGRHGNTEVGEVGQMLAGGVTGTVSWVCCYPVDVLKTQLQAMPADAPAEDRSIFRIAARHLREDGAQFFVRGILPTCLRAFPVSAVTFVVFESMVKLLHGL